MYEPEIDKCTVIIISFLLYNIELGNCDLHGLLIIIALEWFKKLEYIFFLLIRIH